MALQSNTLYIKNDKSLWAVGINDFGQLGVSTNSGTKKPNPNPIKVMDSVRMVSSAGKHTLVLKEDGTVWAFGYNRSGQLGSTTNNGTENANYVPKQVMTDAKFISAGTGCSLVIKNDNSLWAFGSSYFGEFGFVQSVVSTPTKIMDNILYAFGGERQVYVIKSDNTLWSAGENSSGQLGRPDNYGNQNANPAFAQIATDVRWVIPSLGTTHFIKTDNTLWGMGSDFGLLLGTGDGYIPKKILDDVVFASSGRNHVDVIRSDKSLWTFGKNDFGQLGHTDSLGSQAAVPPKKVADNIRTVMGGFEHVVYIQNNSGFWGFGYNYDGNLANTYQNGSTNPNAFHLRAEDDVMNIMNDGGFDAFNGIRDPVSIFSGVTIEPVSPSVVYGSTLQLRTIGQYSDGLTAEVTLMSAWTTQHSILADYVAGSPGLIKGNAQGATQVTATHRSKTANATLNVTNTQLPTPTLTGITLTPNTISLDIGGTQSFTAVANFSDGSSQNINTQASWSFSSSAVASVSANVLTALAAGSGTLTVSYGGQTATASVTVRQPAPKITHLQIIPGYAQLFIGQSLDLAAQAIYSDGSNKIITPVWSSSNINIADITTAGKVTSKSSGSVNITAAYVENGTTYTESIQVTSLSGTGNISLYISYSVDGKSFTPWELYNGNPPQARYVRFKAELSALAGSSTPTRSFDFDQTYPENMLTLRQYAEANGLLKLKTRYSSVMADSGGSGTGNVHSIAIRKSDYKKIEKIEVT